MSKKPITIIASEQAYHNLSTFSNITDLNNTLRSFKEQYSNQLNKTQVEVLDLLHHYSAKYRGVSFLSKNSIAEKIGKSRRTIIRVCQHLEELSIIKQYEMKRASDCQQTSNAIVIQPIDLVGISDKQKGELNTQNLSVRELVTQAPEESVTPEDNTLLKPNQIINNVTKEPTVEQLDSTYLGNNIPQPFVNAVKPFFNSAKEIKSLYSKVRMAFKRCNLDVSLDELTHDVVGVFKSSIFKLKSGAIRKDFKGYFFKSIERTFDDIYYAELQELIASEQVTA